MECFGWKSLTIICLYQNSYWFWDDLSNIHFNRLSTKIKIPNKQYYQLWNGYICDWFVFEIDRKGQKRQSINQTIFKSISRCNWNFVNLFIYLMRRISRGFRALALACISNEVLNRIKNEPIYQRNEQPSNQPTSQPMWFDIPFHTRLFWWGDMRDVSNPQVARVLLSFSVNWSIPISIGISNMHRKICNACVSIVATVFHWQSILADVLVFVSVKRSCWLLLYLHVSCVCVENYVSQSHSIVLFYSMLLLMFSFLLQSRLNTHRWAVCCVLYIARVTIHMHMAEQRLSKLRVSFLRSSTHTHTYICTGSQERISRKRERKNARTKNWCEHGKFKRKSFRT